MFVAMVVYPQIISSMTLRRETTEHAHLRLRANILLFAAGLPLAKIMILWPTQILNVGTPDTNCKMHLKQVKK